MKTRLLTTLGACAVALGGVSAAVPAAAQDAQVLPNLTYRTGPYAPGGIPLSAGLNDFWTLVNERDGGVNGVKLAVEECETGYKTDRGVECYDRTKATAGSVYNPYSTGITYAIIEKATADKIPVLSMGYGRTSAADGRVFPYIFNFPATYWSQATAVVSYIGSESGGMDKLKGQNFAFIYLDHPYGKEPIPFLDIMSEKYGFTYDKYPVPPASMTEQKSIWLQIRKSKPDYAIMWGWGAMNATAIKEAAAVRFPMDRFIGNWWSGAEPDVLPAGDGAVGYKSANMTGAGKGYKIYDDLKKHVYDAGKADNMDKVGEVLYNRALINAAYVVEAMRVAQGKYGNRKLTGEEIRWGLENLDITPERIEELGMTGLMVPVKVTCENHEGLNPGIKMQQWDGKQWNVIVDFVPALSDIVRPVVEEEAMRYAQENNITPRDCG